jgi:hypothetical protein
MSNYLTNIYQTLRDHALLENTGYTSIADIGRFGRIPVYRSCYVYTILKELNIIHTHTSFLLYIKMLTKQGGMARVKEYMS